MTTLANVAAELKFVKVFDNPTGEEGYGFFSLSAYGLPDAHFGLDLLRQHGFEPKSLVDQVGVPAVIDIQRKDGKIHAIRICEIDGVAAGDPLPEPVEEDEVAPATSDIDFNGTEVNRSQERRFGYKPGDVVPARLENGFQLGGKTENYGFFAPLTGAKNIFVHINYIEMSLRSQIAEAEAIWNVVIKDFDSRGPIGEIKSRHYQGVDPSQQAAPKSSRKLRKKPRQSLVLQAELLARNNLQVAGSNGARLFGTPVTEKEWPLLPDGQYAILVSSFDSETGVAGEPLEAFRVTQRGGKKQKALVQSGLTLREQVQAEQVWAPFVPVDTALCAIEEGGPNRPVPLFRESDKARAEQLHKLLKEDRLKVKNAVVKHVVLQVGSVYALLSHDSPIRKIDKPQLIGQIMEA